MAFPAAKAKDRGTRCSTAPCQMLPHDFVRAAEKWLDETSKLIANCDSRVSVGMDRYEIEFIISNLPSTPDAEWVDAVGVHTTTCFVLNPPARTLSEQRRRPSARNTGSKCSTIVRDRVGALREHRSAQRDRNTERNSLSAAASTNSCTSLQWAIDLDRC